VTWADTDPGGAEAGYVDQIRAEVTAIAAILRAHGPDAPVLACPGWNVGDVVGHLGDVHRWATEVVRTGADCATEWTPPEGDALLPWFESGAATLCQPLDEVDPEHPCWTFGRPPGRAGFWRRRQAFEAVVHHFDVAHATGTPFDLSPAIAARGVTEVVSFMYPRQVAMERTAALALPVRLRATDTSDTWVVGEPGEPRAEVAGPATSLLLMLWRRPADHVTRTGDGVSLSAFDSLSPTP
jgi:uncharacterized protein (TIGR03083 family)